MCTEHSVIHQCSEATCCKILLLSCCVLYLVLSRLRGLDQRSKRYSLPDHQPVFSFQKHSSLTHHSSSITRHAKLISPRVRLKNRSIVVDVTQQQWRSRVSKQAVLGVDEQNPYYFLKLDLILLLVLVKITSR